MFGCVPGRSDSVRASERAETLRDNDGEQLSGEPFLNLFQAFAKACLPPGPFPLGKGFVTGTASYTPRAGRGMLSS